MTQTVCDTEGTPDKATHYKGAVEPLEVMS